MSDGDASGDETPPCSRYGRPASYRVGEGTSVEPVCARHLHKRRKEAFGREHPVMAWLEEHRELWVPAFRAVSSTLSPITSLTGRLYDVVAGPRPPARTHRDGYHGAREAYRDERPHEVVEAAERALEPYAEARLRREECQNLYWLVEWYVRAADAVDHPVPRKFQYPLLAIAGSEMYYFGHRTDADDEWTDETVEAVLLPFYDRLRADALAYQTLWKQLETLRGDHAATQAARRELVDTFLARPPLPRFADKVRELLADRNPRRTIPLALARYDRSVPADKQLD